MPEALKLAQGLTAKAQHTKKKTLNMLQENGGRQDDVWFACDAVQSRLKETEVEEMWGKCSLGVLECRDKPAITFGLLHENPTAIYTAGIVDDRGMLGLDVFVGGSSLGRVMFPTAVSDPQQALAVLVVLHGGLGMSLSEIRKRLAALCWF